MNAHALLSSQGWRGTGHSLHKTDDSIGLSKPLYINRKNNTKGLGVSQYNGTDQWWLSAFDEQLKGLESDKKGGVKQTLKKGKLSVVGQGALAKYSVYTSFVSGGLLQGTLDMLNKQAEGSSESTTTSSSETDEDVNGDKSNKKEKKRSSSSSGMKGSDKDKAKETKEERRVRREAKRKRKEARALRRAARQARRERRRAKKNEKNSKSSKSASDSSDSAIDEEKRRRRAKKEEKRRKRKEKE